MNWSAAELRGRTVEPVRVRAASGGSEHEVWDACRKEQRSKAKGPEASDHTGQTVDSMWDYSAATPKTAICRNKWSCSWRTWSAVSLLKIIWSKFVKLFWQRNQAEFSCPIKDIFQASAVWELVTSCFKTLRGLSSFWSPISATSVEPVPIATLPEKQCLHEAKSETAADKIVFMIPSLWMFVEQQKHRVGRKWELYVHVVMPRPAGCSQSQIRPSKWFSEDCDCIAKNQIQVFSVIWRENQTLQPMTNFL